MKRHIVRGLIIIGALGYLLSAAKYERPNHAEKAINGVVYITNKAKDSGGTGFHIQAPSGQKYIMTNGHVCSGVGKNGVVYVRTGENDQAMPRRVIEESTTTDLCIVEALPTGSAADLSKTDPNTREELQAVGHPRLQPLTITKGTAVARQKTKVLLSYGYEPGECDDPKHEKSEIKMFFFMVPVCLLNIDAISTTIPILPGSSGSPILNSQGKVVGVAFASSNEANWASIIPVTELNKFIANY